MDIPRYSGGGATMDVGGGRGSRPLWYSSPGISFLQYLIQLKDPALPSITDHIHSIKLCARRDNTC